MSETIPETIYFKESHRNDNDSYFISITEISNKIPIRLMQIFISSNGWKIHNYPYQFYKNNFHVFNSRTSKFEIYNPSFINFIDKEIYLSDFNYSNVLCSEAPLGYKLDNNFRDRFWEVSFVLNEFKHYCENKFK